MKIILDFIIKMCYRSDFSKDIIDLYKKVPEYGEVKHLGCSDFENRIEKLKEEFRGIRCSILDDSAEVEVVFEPAVTKSLKFKSERNDQLKRIDFDTKDNSAKTSTSYLSVRKCPLYSNQVPNLTCYRSITTKPLFINGNKFASQPNLNSYRNNWRFSSISTISDSLSHTSSNPEISIRRLRNEYVPPQNVENRLTQRKAVEKVVENRNDFIEIEPKLKPSRVPSSVTRPMFDKILRQNNIRSQRVRDQSKEKLLTRMKPFSFCTTNQKNRNHLFNYSDNQGELLNNSKIMKTKKTSNFKIHNNSLDYSGQHFKALPAPPRSKALMSALRFKEQQEYRDLKKHLRAEALMKMSSLPPSMASRDKNRHRSKATTPCSTKYRDSKSAQVTRDADSTCTDEDRLSDNSRASSRSEHKIHTPGQNLKRHKTAFHGSCESGISNLNRRSGGIGVFESASNDNNASRLRVAAIKKKEEERLHRVEQELLKQRREEEKRYKLRSYHSDAWNRACSYLSSRDIAMRYELRMAAAILESDSFRKNMSSMLNRVQSAPLLLEGLRQRRIQPCKKHQEGLADMTRKSKLVEPRLTSFKNDWKLSRGYQNNVAIDGNSETLALADGTSSSDNESSVSEIAVENEEKIGQCDAENLVGNPVEDEDDIELQADIILEDHAVKQISEL